VTLKAGVMMQKILLSYHRNNLKYIEYIIYNLIYIENTLNKKVLVIFDQIESILVKHKTLLSKP